MSVRSSEGTAAPSSPKCPDGLKREPHSRRRSLRRCSVRGRFRGERSYRVPVEGAGVNGIRPEEWHTRAGVLSDCDWHDRRLPVQLSSWDARRSYGAAGRVGSITADDDAAKPPRYALPSVCRAGVARLLSPRRSSRRKAKMPVLGGRCSASRAGRLARCALSRHEHRSHGRRLDDRAGRQGSRRSCEQPG